MSTITNATRLDRIEEKIDKMSDTIIALARAEEKLSSLESLNVDLHRKIDDIEERLRYVEAKLRDSQNELRIINKIFWIAISALVTGGIAMVFFSNSGEMF